MTSNLPPQWPARPNYRPATTDTFRRPGRECADCLWGSFALGAEHGICRRRPPFSNGQPSVPSTAWCEFWKVREAVPPPAAVPCK